MSRWFFPLGLILILFVAALSHWEHRTQAAVEAAGSTRPSTSTPSTSPPSTWTLRTRSSEDDESSSMPVERPGS